MKALGLISGLALAAASFVGFASAEGAKVDASCNVNASVDDISYRDAHNVYLCLERKMFEGYNTGDKRWVNAAHVGSYRTWKPASTLPANPGAHTERFLFTYVNKIGEEAYTKFAEGVTMPVGTVLAKESFSINSKGKSKPGPLFIMEKVAAGTSPKTGDWFYTMVSPKGVPQGINVYKACHECHSGFEDSDFLGYPEEELRRTN